MRIAVEIAFSFKRELGDDYRSLDLPPGATVHDALQALVARYPRMGDRLFDEKGQIRRHINALVNGGNVQFRERFETPLQEGDRLTILPPVGGG